MKKIMLSFFLLLFCNSLFAGNINRLIFFGDSLSDNGNLYKMLINILPKSPPYYQGRFSNGPTWAENVAKYYADKYHTTAKNYAYGGATSTWHQPKIKFIAPTTLPLEIANYLVETGFKDRSHTLFFIWIGGNDYLFEQEADSEKLTSNVVAGINWAVNTLYLAGARNFVLLNLPELADVPLAQSGSPAKLHEFSVMHNQKLKTLVDGLRFKLMGAKIDYLDVYSLFVDVMQDPEKYNQKYHIHITDTKGSCWLGGYTFKSMLSDANLQKELQQSLNQDSMQGIESPIDIQHTATFIQTSPDISQAYIVGKLYEQGLKPCSNADEHIFWDHIHPTQIVHKILSQIVIEDTAAYF